MGRSQGVSAAASSSDEQAKEKEHLTYTLLGLDHRVGHFRPLRIMGVTPNLHVLNGLEASTWDRSSWGGRRRDQGQKLIRKNGYFPRQELAVAPHLSVVKGTNCL